MGSWTFIEPNIEWVLGKIEAKHKPSAPMQAVLPVRLRRPA
jgi:hypothetical protein